MAGPTLPPPLRAFLYSCIDSIEQAELLVRLQQSDEAYNAHALGRELGITDAAARHHLETLVARGLLQAAIGTEVSYRYAPRSDELRRFAALLQEWWGRARPEVLRAIAADQASPLKSFSNAFKIRRQD